MDVATYYVMYESSSPRANGSDSIYDRWPDTVDNKEEMPLDCELLLPNAIEGFHLGSKKWGRPITVDTINPPSSIH